MRKFYFLISIFLLTNPCFGFLPSKLLIDEKRIEIFEKNILRYSEEANLKSHFLLAQDSKKLLISDENFEVNLGKSSAAIIAFLAKIMEEKNSKNFLNKKAFELSHLFKIKESDVLLVDLLSSTANIAQNIDALLPKDADYEDLFDMIFQLSKSATSASDFAYSKASVSAGAYLLAYSEFKNENNLYNSYGLLIQKYLDFLPSLKLKEIESEKKVLLPASNITLSLKDIFTWLDKEFSFIRTDDIAYKRVVKNGWVSTKLGNSFLIMAGDSFGGQTTLFVMIPSHKVVFAIVVESDSKEASALTKKLLENLTFMLEELKLSN